MSKTKILIALFSVTGMVGALWYKSWVDAGDRTVTRENSETSNHSARLLEDTFVDQIPAPLKGDMADMITSVNEITFQMAHDLAPASSTGNHVYSPTSIAQVLWVMGAAAKGQTSATLASGLHLQNSWDELLKANETWMDWSQKLKGTDVEMANALWHEASIQIRPEFQKRLTQTGLQFKKLNPDLNNAVEEINDWSRQETHGKISSVINQLDEQTSMVVANAVYFKGSWQEPFPKDNTRDEPFHNADGTRSSSPMMKLDSEFYYARIDGDQWLQLPYKFYGEFSMILVLPGKGKTGTHFLNEMSGSAYIAIREAMDLEERSEGKVDLPRFSVKSEMNLLPVLDRLDIGDAFNGGDFSGMSPQMEEGIATAMKQVALVEVDEKGTEAAATTVHSVSVASVILPNDGKPFHFRADRPFAFFIEDANHMILFAGAVNSLAGEL